MSSFEDLPDEWAEFYWTGMSSEIPDGDPFDGGMAPEGECGYDGYATSEIYPTADEPEQQPDDTPFMPDAVPHDVVPQDAVQASDGYLENKPFTHEDKKAAWRAGQIFSSALAGDGWFGGFLAQPDRTDHLQQAINTHNDDIESFIAGVQHFGNFVDKAGQFIDRPVVTMRTTANQFGDEFLEVSEERIEERDVAMCTLFHNQLATYAGALLAHGPEAPDTMAAAQTLSAMLDPDVWRAAGAEIPETWHSVSGINAQNYFALIYSQHSEPSGEQVDRMTDGTD